MLQFLDCERFGFFVEGIPQHFMRKSSSYVLLQCCLLNFQCNYEYFNLLLVLKHLFPISFFVTLFMNLYKPPKLPPIPCKILLQQLVFHQKCFSNSFRHVIELSNNLFQSQAIGVLFIPSRHKRPVDKRAVHICLRHLCLQSLL